jgi:cell division protease FtsH
MMWWKHFRMWFGNHWIKIFLIVFGVSILCMLGYGIRCFMQLESFYKQYMFAAVPLQIPVAMLHTFIFIFGYWYLIRNSMSKTVTATPPEKINVHFTGVLGIDEAKEECMEVVQLIKDRQRVKHIGGKIVKGILMLGPPGCGKTLLAKAIACETGIPFLSMAGSEFTEMYVGVGASRVRKLFTSARKYVSIYGACIVFIDEIDAIARGRQFSVGGGGQETNATQNQLLVEMDGLNETTGCNIIIIGATNAPVESLDQALLRPGRFDRKIVINYPYADGRNDVFKYYLNKVKYDPGLDTMRLANYMIGRSPADIENVVKEAALICTRDGRNVVEMRDLTAALERVELGQERKRKVHPLELQRTAYHESGHAILLYYLHPVNDVFKVSVATRGSTLGVMHNQPIVEMEGKDQTTLEASITVSLGGYCAEKLIFNENSWGCSADFDNAMNTARLMVYRIGMGGHGLVGDFFSFEKQGYNSLSDGLKKTLNDDVVEILQRCLKQAMQILTRERALLEKMAEILIDKKTLEYDEVTEICKQHGVGKSRKIEERGLLQEFQKLVSASSLHENVLPSRESSGEHKKENPGESS